MRKAHAATCRRYTLGMRTSPSTVVRSRTASEAPVASGSELHALRELVSKGSVLVLTGAGCSTESGIPDYRGPEGTLRSRSPMQYQDFVSSEKARARYWSRSLIGWGRFSGSRPNAGHRAFAELERRGLLAGIITQNVDGLHQAAGARNVIELHGSLARVRCLDCGSVESRDHFQVRLEASNPRVASEGGPMMPDGDVEIPAGSEASFQVAGCSECDGIIKPDVVFFGEPVHGLDEAASVVSRSDLLLVLGSSLSVYPAAFLPEAAGGDVVVVNNGEVGLAPGPDRYFVDADLDGFFGEVRSILAP